jgi:phage terminase large subunit
VAVSRRQFLKASAAAVGAGWVADLSAAGDDDIDYIGGKILSYRPLPAPAGFHASQAKFRWIMGGNRSGKSESNIGYDLCSFALGLHPFRVTPRNATIWAVADNWPLVGKLLWGEKIKDYLPACRIKKMIWHNRQEEIPQEAQLDNDNRIEFKAGEQGRTAFEGRPIHAIYQDEQIKSDSEGIFTEMQARLLDYNGFFAGSMTPIRPQPWLEERIIELPDTDDVFYANLNDNRKSRDGYIDDSEIDLMIADWPVEVQETRIKGYFAAFMGAVYKTFNRKVHVCKPFKIPSDWQRYRAIDWGFNNPFVCLWMARDHDSRWYVYNEHYAAQQTLAYHAACIKRTSGRERYRVTWADHEAQERHEFKQLGINTMPAKKDVHLGIEAVQAALKIQGDGRPRLQIFDTCKHTIKETGGYKWAEGNETRDAKDEPLKLNDHTQDCTRYIIYGVDHKGYFSRLVA